MRYRNIPLLISNPPRASKKVSQQKLITGKSKNILFLKNGQLMGLGSLWIFLVTSQTISYVHMYQPNIQNNASGNCPSINMNILLFFKRFSLGEVFTISDRYISIQWIGCTGAMKTMDISPRLRIDRTKKSDYWYHKSKQNHSSSMWFKGKAVVIEC